MVTELQSHCSAHALGHTPERQALRHVTLRAESPSKVVRLLPCLPNRFRRHWGRFPQKLACILHLTTNSTFPTFVIKFSVVSDLHGSKSPFSYRYNSAAQSVMKSSTWGRAEDLSRRTVFCTLLFCKPVLNDAVQ